MAEAPASFQGTLQASERDSTLKDDLLDPGHFLAARRDAHHTTAQLIYSAVDTVDLIRRDASSRSPSGQNFGIAGCVDEIRHAV